MRRAFDGVEEGGVETRPQTPPSRGEPRNWLRRTEQRRLFWTWMPPALVLLLLVGQVERVFLAPPAAEAVDDVDTVLARGPVTRTIDDAVTIEAPAVAPAEDGADGPSPGPDGSTETAAPRAALERVRDDTVFRADDGPAWFAIWARLAEERAGERRPPPSRRVSFAQLFEQPDSFRGRRVRFEGTIRRLQEVASPANDAGVERTWQAWVEPAGGPPTPIVVYFLDIPEGTPTGMRVDVPVVVEGVFFKRWAYQASDAIRLAPLVMAVSPRPAPRIETGRGTSPLAGWALLSMVCLVAVTAAALRLASPRAARRVLPERLEIGGAGSDDGGAA